MALQPTSIAPFWWSLRTPGPVCEEILNAVAARQLATYETLLTFLTEVESLLNSRPLIRVSSDRQGEEALTPNHFIVGRASSNLPMHVVNERDMSSRKRWKHAKVMTNYFWRHLLIFSLFFRVDVNLHKNKNVFWEH